MKGTTKQIEEFFVWLEVYERLVGDSSGKKNFGVKKASVNYDHVTDSVGRLTVMARKHVDGAVPGGTQFVIDENIFDNEVFPILYEKKIKKFAKWMLDNNVSSSEKLNKHLKSLVYRLDKDGNVIMDKDGNLKLRPESDIFKKVKLYSSPSIGEVLEGVDSMTSIVRNELIVYLGKFSEEELYRMAYKTNNVLDEYINKPTHVYAKGTGSFILSENQAAVHANEIIIEREADMAFNILQNVFGKELLDKADVYMSKIEEKAKEKENYTIKDNNEIDYSDFIK